MSHTLVILARFAALAVALMVAAGVPWDIATWGAGRSWTWLLAESIAGLCALRLFGWLAFRGISPPKFSPPRRRALSVLALALVIAAGVLDLSLPPDPAPPSFGHWPILWAIALIIALRGLLGGSQQPAERR